MTFETDLDVLEAALATVGLDEPENARVVQISNTLQLSEVLVSEAYLPEVSRRSDLEILDGGPCEMEFDADGFLLPVAASGLTVH